VSWPMVELGLYLDKISTWDPVKSELNELIDYVDLSSVDKEKKVIEQNFVTKINSVDAPSRARQILAEGDVLVSTVRPNLNGVALVPPNNDGATASTGYCVLRPKTKFLDGKYLFFWVQTRAFVNDMIAKATGANYPAVSDKIVKSSKIPLPPVPIQKQIAAVLDKADTLRQQCQQMEQELNALAQAVFLEMFGDPIRNPKNWAKKRIKELVKDFIGGKSLASAETEENSGAYRVLKISAVTTGEFKPEESKPLPDDYTPRAEHYVKANNLLFSRANTTELVGATAFVFSSPENLLLPDKLWRFVWHDSDAISQVFYWQLLSSKGLREQLGKISSGSGGSMKNISKGKLNELEVIYPPIEMQLEYEQTYMQIRHQKQIVSEQLCVLNENFNSLMQSAFKGELDLKAGV
jgi:type I restriction enzyme, S subunit